MSDPAEMRMFDLGFAKGMEVQQERIIKLLVDELYINPNSNYGQQLIALIKGEK